MTVITKTIETHLDNLRDAAHGGLARDLGTFILRSISLIYSAPGTFKSSEDLEQYLVTLTDLIDTKVYSR